MGHPLEGLVSVMAGEGLHPLLKRTVGSIKVRDRLEAFAAAEGLQL